MRSITSLRLGQLDGAFQRSSSSANAGDANAIDAPSRSEPQAGCRIRRTEPITTAATYHPAHETPLPF
jgi:hypothetical protein